MRLLGGADGAAAYKELFLRYYDRLVAFSEHLTHSRFMAEETVSDVLLRIWLNRASAAAIENPNLYLYRSVRNAAINALEKERRHAHGPEAETAALPAGAATDPEQVLLGRETGSRLQTIVESLPPQCRLILRLVKEEGLRYREVAELLGLSVKTIESQMAIALRRLSKGLQPAGQTSLN